MTNTILTIVKNTALKLVFRKMAVKLLLRQLDIENVHYVN